MIIAALWSCVLGFGPSCAAAEPKPRAEPWPAADGLFRRDARWLGGDAAYSVDLGRGRVLWLFGDSFIARSTASLRTEAVMVHNSVAVEEGLDPSSAAIRFYWAETAGKPVAFFRVPDGGLWYWPLHGLRLGDVLLLFFALVRPMSEGGGPFGFQTMGWDLLRVENPDEALHRWTARSVMTMPWTRGRKHLIVGSSALISGDYLYAFGATEPEHDVDVLRWEVRIASAGFLSAPQGWEGVGRGWVPLSVDDDLGRLAPVFENGQTEFSVHYDPGLKRFIEVQSEGFGGSDIAIRTAGRLEGPWTPLETVYRPPESSRPGVLVYAAKAHPELSCGAAEPGGRAPRRTSGDALESGGEDVLRGLGRGGADSRAGGGCGLVVTYATNAFNFKALVGDSTLYFPRFVRIVIPR